MLWSLTSCRVSQRRVQLCEVLVNFGFPQFNFLTPPSVIQLGVIISLICISAKTNLAAKPYLSFNRGPDGFDSWREKNAQKSCDTATLMNLLMKIQFKSKKSTRLVFTRIELYSLLVILLMVLLIVARSELS